MRHATEEEIIAYRDGDLTDAEMEKHVHSCQFCRRRLKDARWLRVHLRRKSGTAPGPVPSRDEIAAYLDEALEEVEMRRVESHIQSNESCLVILDQLMNAGLEVKDSFPSTSHVEKLKKRLKKRPGNLGRLVIFIGDQLQQLFLPAEPELAGRGRSESAPRMAARPAASASRLAVTASLRREILQARKWSRSFSDSTLEFDQDILSAAQPTLPLRSETPVKPKAPPKPTPPVVIDAGRWRVRAVTKTRDTEMFLELRVTDSKSGKPSQHLPISLKAEGEKPIRVETDRTGRTRLSLPEGSARLEIDRGPEVIIDIQATKIVG